MTDVLVPTWPALASGCMLTMCLCSISCSDQGYIVGNGVTDPFVDGGAFPSFAVGKSLISMQLFNDIQKACSAVAPEHQALVADRGTKPSGDASVLLSAISSSAAAETAVDSTECTKLMATMQRELAPLNLYNVLEECHHKKKPRPEPSAVLPSAAAAAAVSAVLASSRKLSAAAVAAGAATAKAAKAGAVVSGAEGSAVVGQAVGSEKTWSAGVSANLPDWLKGLRGLDASEAYAAVRSSWKGWPVMGGVAQGSKVYNWGHLLGLDPPCTVSR